MVRIGPLGVSKHHAFDAVLVGCITCRGWIYQYYVAEPVCISQNPLVRISKSTGPL